ncbi:MAG: ATP-binding protein, partial [Thermoanaerobaculia bacterium]|nr:ATP-binding protein [Thermoanaerobaculia bacterium]
GDLRVTVIQGDGVVLADTARSFDGVRKMDNHRSRPEVRAALTEREGWSVRRSVTTGEVYIYVARRETDAEGRLFVLRLARRLDEVHAVQAGLLRALLFTAGAALLTVFVVWWGLRRHLFRPLSELVEGANRLARGDYSGHLDAPEAEELSALAGALNRLSDRVEEQIEQVRSERNHLQEILSSMSDGILVANDDGRVQFVNQRLRTLFDIDSETPVEGKTPLELTRRPELVSLVSDCLEGGEAASDPRLPFESGRILAASAVPVSTGGVLLVVRDVTERVHLDETRRDFVANVSHEIKTPLTAIRGYAETLKEGALEDPEVALKFTERVLGQCQRLEALLADLLPLARMEATEQDSLETEAVELDALIEHAAELVRPRAERREIAIELDLAQEMPPYEGDHDALEQLVLNLLDNAVKYNRDGGEVRVTLRSSDDEIRLEVTDTGIGIPPESVPRVFERFYRVDKGRAREEGGTGLGLALVKHAAKLHGGTVELDSRLGSGSTFRVVLPR